MKFKVRGAQVRETKIKRDTERDTERERSLQSAESIESVFLSYIKISYNYFVRMMIIFEILSRCELQFRDTCPAHSMWS